MGNSKSGGRKGSGPKPYDGPIVIRNSQHSITFRATSNSYLTATQYESLHPTSIRAHFQNAKLFISAFSDGRQKHQGEETLHPDTKIVHISDSSEETQTIFCDQGLVGAICQAYNRHRNLQLRPDDFWIAILTQFGNYVGGRAEHLRNRIVDFPDKRGLVIEGAGSFWTADFGELANQMVDEQIAKNIRDPSLVDWLLPAFSTTTSTDRVAASVSVMSAMQNYFTYKFCFRCGIPEVTLLGSVADWEMLRAKVDRLLEFELPESDLMAKWHGWLSGICDNLILSARGEIPMQFWECVCHSTAGGSGPSYTAGWISAFCLFSSKGEWLDKSPIHLPLDRTGGAIAQYPVIETDDIPSGVTMVPVIVVNAGKQYDCKMCAGQVCFDVAGDRDTIVPRSDWCIATII